MSTPSEIYLDNAATTRPLPEVLAAMQPFWGDRHGNPSSLHRRGVEAWRVLQRSRELLADALHARADDVIFTSGGTEANALGVLGGARARHGHTVLVSAIEHPAVLESAQLLEREGYRVIEIPVDACGLVDPAWVGAHVDEEVCAVAVLHASNEIGSVQPVAEIARAVRARNPRTHLHVDAVQSFGKERVDLDSLGVDSIALSGHKIHGPQGVGCLVLRAGVPLIPLWGGGGQQRGLRSGTENLAAIAGLTEAARLALAARRDSVPQMRALRDRLILRLLGDTPGVRLNGHPTQRLCNNVHLSVDGVQSEHLLHALEARGVLGSVGSACHARDSRPSKTLRAIGQGRADQGHLRLSLSRFTTDDEIGRAARAFAQAVAELRILAP
ncbi:MAG: cysteine desulfurase family protein [Pseudomonadota bacterium]